jgi:hypothetical protein
MKKPLLFGAMALFAMALFAGCGGSTTPATTDSTKSKMDTVVMMRPIQSPYPIGYSSAFAMDDPKNAESLLALWKAYDAGTLSTAKDLLADTVDVVLANGFTMRASRDSVIAAIQSHRNMYKAVSSDVTAVLSMKSTDKNQHWALIWGAEKDTHKDGKVESTDLHEAWQFDNNGKATMVLQYAQTVPKAMAPMKKK